MRSRLWFAALLIGLLALGWIGASDAVAETFDLEPGTPEENYTNLMTAFEAAVANDAISDEVDVIRFAAGYYRFDRGFSVDHLRNVRLVGAGRDVTVLEAVRVSDVQGFVDEELFLFRSISGEFEVSNLTMQVVDPHPRDPYFNWYLGPHVDNDGDGAPDANTTALSGLLVLVGRDGPYDLRVSDVALRGASGDGVKWAHDSPLPGKNLAYGVVNFVSHFGGKDTYSNVLVEHCADTALEGAWAFLDTELTIEDSTFIECFHAITAPYLNESPVRISDSEFWGNYEEICVRGDLNCYSATGGNFSLVQLWEVDPAGGVVWGGTVFDYTKDVEVTGITIDGIAQPDYVIDDSPPVAAASDIRVIDDDLDGSETVKLDALDSFSPYPDDRIVRYEWRLDGELIAEDPPGEAPPVAPSQEPVGWVDLDLPVGKHTITLTVYDNRSVVPWWMVWAYSPPPLPGNTTFEVEIVEPMVIDETIDGNVTVDDNTVIVHGTVKGNITQRGDGSVVVADGGVVEGNIRESGQGDVVVTGNALVKGNLVERHDGSVEVDGSTIEGNISERGAGDVVVKNDALVKGNLVERHDGSVEVDGSTIEGNISESGAGDVALKGAFEKPTLIAGNICEKGGGTIVGLDDLYVEVQGGIGR